jgi:hypothetical protein
MNTAGCSGVEALPDAEGEGSRAPTRHVRAVNDRFGASYRDILVARGLPATFLDDFEAAVTEIEESLSERQWNRAKRLEATQALAFVERDGRAVLRVLHALVRRAVGQNETLLRSWQTARLVYSSTTRTDATAVPAA